ncbi:MAG: single-stranded-DNA-specific exonuclease RecJ [Thermoflexales bacterium]|nr:single-stranded-DNA-specific exonuclease RecJ [Thermoflexales bacterium]
MTRWEVAARADSAFLDAMQAAGFDAVVAQTLFARGFATPEAALAWLDPTPGGKPVDPFALTDLPLAVERILGAIDADEPIVVYGDYDCDGVTACALMHHTLHALGARFSVYIPNRFEEGYGLNARALEELAANGARLVIAVDCGARAFREANRARELGLDLIITDHHDLDLGGLPAALAVVNPKRGGAYGFDALAGVGVAFRLAQGLLRTRKAAGRPAPLAESALIDLVAIGTVADVVPLVGENRALVRAGLAAINRGPRLGVSALMKAAHIQPGKVDAQAIGFALGPRLNAAGRLESARAAYELLVTDNAIWADELATTLNHRNEQRQTLTAEMARRALELAGEGAVAFAADPTFNAGVIGLAAARLAEKHFRPSIVCAVSEGEVRGSCRSIPGFDITAALDACRDLLLRHGGHAAAAGFTTTPDRVEALHARLEALAQAARPTEGWERVIRADGEFPLAEINWRTLTQLRQLEPHGAGNPRPTLVVRGARKGSVDRIGKSAEGEGPPHLKLRLRDGWGASWEALGWRMGERAAEAAACEHLDLAFHLDVNEWNGEQRLQLILQDFRPAQT